MCRISSVIKISLLLFLVQFGVGEYDPQKLARETPFCITPETIPYLENDIRKLSNSAPQLLPIDVAATDRGPDPDNLQPSKHTKDNGQVYPVHKKPYRHTYDNQNYEVSFHRINYARASGESPIFNMRQWVHIHLVSKIQLEAVYMQSISSPLGVPFGEFRRDFECKDCLLLNINSKSARHVTPTDIQIIPCTFRPYHAITHPNVAFYMSPGKTSFTEFHIHFTWSEGKCHEVALMQFFILLRNKGSESNKAFFTQVLNNTVTDSIDMTSYPVYPELPESEYQGKPMICHEPPEEPWLFAYNGKYWSPDMVRRYEPLKLKPLRRKHARLLYNKEYDDCIVRWRSNTDGMCPPGPFRCTTHDRLPVKHRTLEHSIRKRVKFYSNGSNTNVCPSCYDLKNKPTGRKASPKRHPLEGEFDMELNQTTRNNSFLIEDEFWSNSNHTVLDVRSTHGILMIFAFIICPSISNYLARFFKETGNADAGYQFASVGMWLWIHIIGSYLSLATMWGAVGVLMFYETDCDKKDSTSQSFCFEAEHQIPGLVAMVLFHINHLNGWCRPMTRKWRIWYITCHVIFGYASQILAAVAFFIVTSYVDDYPVELLTAVIVSLSITALFNILGTILQIRIDKTMNLSERRQILPIPEAITVHEDVPYAYCQYILLVTFFIIQVGLFLWVVVSRRTIT